MSGPKTLVLDLETAPNIVSAWSLFKTTISINQILTPGRVICVGAKWVGDRTAKLFSEWDDDGHQGMIEAAWHLVNEADAIVSYNGIGFDRKWLNVEFLQAGLAPPSPAKDIDLLQTTRKQFMLPSRKLDYVAQTLNLGSKTSHSGMGLWNSVLHGEGEEREKARRLMAKYCKQDVNLTEKLYLELLPWIDGHVNAGLFTDEDDPVCTNCGSGDLQRRGWAYTTHLRYRRFQCNSCMRWLRSKKSEKVAELRPA